ncbi:hypothetical protein BH09CHL1_BH09CHL1_04200 [soil metagenome]
MPSPAAAGEGWLRSRRGEGVRSAKDACITNKHPHPACGATLSRFDGRGQKRRY